MNWLEFERFARALQAAPWRFATTMQDHPHSYTLRKMWTDEEFTAAVIFLRAYGYDSTFQRKTYRQINVNEHCYWTMGAPLAETILINRARLVERTPYDRIATRYDELFRDTRAVREEMNVLTAIESFAQRPITGMSVLDVGCGTGMLLRHVTPARYIGVDPSAAMLVELRHRHPSAAVVQTPLERFAPAADLKRFDLVLGLFGVGSYLSDAELARIPTLLASGGLGVVMFYQPGYHPETYVRAKVTVPHRAWHQDAATVLGDGPVAYRVIEDERYTTVLFQPAA